MAQIRGEVRVANGLPASGLAFGLFRQRFAADPERIASVQTAEDGTFAGPDLDLDPRATFVARIPGDDGHDVVLTPVGPQDPTALRLVVPADAASGAFKSEFARLNDAVAPVLGGASLATAQENADRRDLTLIHRESGWDARLIATAALSSQLNHGGGGQQPTGIDDQALYGLLRTGLPSSRALLARVPVETMKAALEKAAASGVIDLDEGQREQTVAQFQTFARQELLGSRPAGGVSTVSELLDASGLPGEGDDSPRQRFEEVLLATGNAESLWKRAADAGIDDDAIRNLQGQAKLAFLTTNNVPLMARVQEGLGQEQTLGEHLANGRWDQAATWSQAIDGVGGAGAVPAAFKADEQPVAAYAEELARRVRVSYPTHVVAGMLKSGEISLGHGDLDQVVATTLTQAGERGLRLGATPMAGFMTDNADLLQNVAENDKPQVESALRTLHRTYQLSPSNQSMKALLDVDLTSAYNIAAIPEPIFIDRYGHFFPSELEARLVHRKSQQISAVLCNFYSMTRQATASGPLSVVSGTPAQRDAAVTAIKDSLPHSPTMESLFGSMDYCECDDCRSVLGPAAYLVDLFRFLDPDDLDWQGFKDEWARRRGGEEYPYKKPFDELRERRPDLEQLQLSCENIKTELPVIDIVNEILEYLVAYDSLKGDAVRNSGALDSADVMAEPEFVVDAAYEKLRAAVYPLVLPFDVWHETVRGFLGWLDAPLGPLHEAFRTSEDLDSGGYEAAVDRLGMTRAMADVITDPNALQGWWTRLGYDAAAQEAVAVAELTSAKQLTRRLGVNYQDLADLLETHFVNPSLGALGVLRTASVGVADAIVWRAHQALAAQEAPADETERPLWETAKSVQQRLDTVTRTYGLTGARAADTWLKAIPDAAFQDVVVLLDPDGSCDFERTLLGAAASGTALDGSALARTVVRLDVLVRIRRALDWSTADVDQALRAFVPGGTVGDGCFGEPLRTALVYLARAVELEELLGSDADQRRALLSLWFDLTTNGPAPLYAELFLGRPAGQHDSSFADPLGDTLSTEAVGGGDQAKLRSHVAALQGVLGLRAAEMQAIVDRDGPAWDDHPLSLATVSTLHRYAWLARALGWTVQDLLALERLGGSGPFQALSADPLTTFDDDNAQHATIAFVRTAQRVVEAGTTMTELDYLLAHHIDPGNDLSPDPAATLTILKAVATAVREDRDRALKNAAEIDDAAGAPPAPDERTFVASALAASLGAHDGLVAALVDGPDALADPSAAAGADATVADAFLGDDFLGGAFSGLHGKLADVPAAASAYLLLSKVLLLAGRFGLTARECRVLGLGALPVAPIDGEASLFANLVDLLAYLSLREELRGRSAPDSLLDVLVAATGSGTTPTPSATERLETAVAALALQSRRTPESARAAADAVGLKADDLGTPAGLERLWRVMTHAEHIGVDVATLKGWLPISRKATSLADRQQIARSVKDTVRSHLGPARWRQLAKPVSDSLRQRQRDALVATVMHQHGYQSLEELYQALLIDPGSEPVLRTSRIRQAISSAQLFVQRCLLNIEPRVHPSTLNAGDWEWMKRYRIWEANRKIFLYPENWLEPEFRDDKSHLFAELESTLLQNDVSADVVEDAFLVYLRRLEEIARLDVVAFYTEQDPLDPGSTTLHVIGRTHGGPHQYYYRRLQHGMWTSWEPMGVDIEADHVVPIVWRNRLHVFWVTFLQTSDDSNSNPGSSQLLSATQYALDPISSGGTGFAITQALGGPQKEPKLAEVTSAQVQSSAQKPGVSRRVDVQLHWTEYLKGSWSTTTSGGFGRVPAHTMSSVFDPNSVFVHASTLWENGAEAGVQVHLTGGMTRTFLLRGRNSTPESGTSEAAPSVPYNTPTANINRFLGNNTLTVTFAQKITAVDGGAETPTASTMTLLGRTGAFDMLASANGISLGSGDIGSLVSPFFFQDAIRTFFVQPSLLETTTETWEEWLVPDPDLSATFDPGDLGVREIQPFVPPEIYVPVNPEDPDWLVDPDPWRDLYTTLPQDMLVSPEVGLLYGDTVLGARGGVDLTVVSPQAVIPGRLGRFAGVLQQQAIPVVTADGAGRNPVMAGAPDDGLRADSVVVVDRGSLARAGLGTAANQITVIGAGGLARSHVDAFVNRGFRR